MDFSESVYEATKKIPKGKVSTYGEIARAIGKPRAARAVGNTLNKNPYAPKVPCHRVVKSNFDIGGFASGSENKTKMLRKEGVEIVHNRVNPDCLFNVSQIL